MDATSLEPAACSLCGSARSRVRFHAPAPPGGAVVEGAGCPPLAGDGGAQGSAGVFAATTDTFGGYGTVLECLDCGMVFTSPRPAAEQLLRGYTEHEDIDYLAERDSRSINAHMCLARIRSYAAAGRLLEVGCSVGYFLNAARASYAVTGVEPCAWARRHARERLGLEVAAATLEEARLPDGHFDAAALIDVIEHVADPAALMAEVARVTRPGGLAYLVTPDIGSLSARLLGRYWWGLRPAHVQYFSRRTLSRLLERCGYRVLEARSYGRIFTWQYWLTRLANYPAPLRRTAEACVRGCGLQDKFLYLDTRDSIQVIARKTSA